MKILLTLFIALGPLSLFAQMDLKEDVAGDISGYVEVGIYQVALKKEYQTLVSYSGTKDYDSIMEKPGVFFGFKSVAQVFNFMDKQGYEFITVIPQPEIQKTSASATYSLGHYLFKKR